MVYRAPKDAWLHKTASRLLERTPDLLRANAEDMRAAEANDIRGAMLDRLRLTEKRIADMAEGLRQVAALPDPVGEVREGSYRPNGLEIRKLSVPLGVILFIYEARPNVTLDAAALCVKSGNAVILRGGKEAIHSNTILYEILTETLAASGLPANVVRMVATTDREAVGHLLRLPQYIDLAIPRGGPSLIERVVRDARMPVLKHYMGNCHIYVDRAADLEMAERIVVNAKCQRPAVCNAVESLLIHEEVAAGFLPRLGDTLGRLGVEIRGCARTRELTASAVSATEADYAAEYGDLIVSIKVVPDLDSAVDHIHRYGSQHTEAIVTGDIHAADRFVRSVDSSAVMVNASTRFNDGFELGLGAEIGISTDKFHARGPCGLRELTTTKYVVRGEGHIRE